jgi:aminopeptidase 2
MGARFCLVLLPQSITLNYNPSLHLTHLSLTHPSLSTPYTYDVSSVPSSLISVDTKQERLVISLPEQLGDGVKKGDQLKLRMAWTSELNGSMLGYYRSSWRPDGKDGKEAFYALTQFEPTGALVFGIPRALCWGKWLGVRCGG